jgi:hypothetical protein
VVDTAHCRMRVSQVSMFKTGGEPVPVLFLAIRSPGAVEHRHTHSMYGGEIWQLGMEIQERWVLVCSGGKGLVAVAR